MQIHNAIITGSFSYNGADLSNVTSSNQSSASLSSRTTDLESTSSVLVGASSSFSSILSSVSSSQQQISASLLQVSASYTALSGSYNTFSGSASTRVTQIEQVYATTGSNSFRADQSITGSLVVSSTITAQTLVVQTVTSSILYSSGSNLFGNALGDRQTFTGSVNITGSQTIFGNVVIGNTTSINASAKLEVKGEAFITPIGTTASKLHLYNNDSTNETYIYDSGSSTNSILILSPGGINKALVVSSSGFVGIGTTTPTSLLEVQKDQNAQTGIRVKNSTAGTIAGVEFGAYTNSGNGGFGKYSTGNTPYKNILAGSTYIYNGASGDISLLNDAASGNISFAAGGSSTAQMFISASGNVGIGATNITGKLMIYQGTAGNVFQSIVSNQGGSTQVGINFNPSMSESDAATYQAQSAIYATDYSYSADIIFATKVPGAYANSLTERMKINSAGIVTKPYHPVFHVAKSDGNVSAGNTIIWNFVYTNVGSYYNSSNGRFTAPVAGVYYFAFSVMSDGDVGIDMALQKNGVTYQGCVPLQSAIGSTYNQLTGVCTITLAASDYVTIYNSAGTIYTSNSNGGRHTMFCGFLVG